MFQVAGQLSAPPPPLPPLLFPEDVEVECGGGPDDEVPCPPNSDTFDEFPDKKLIICKNLNSIFVLLVCYSYVCVYLNHPF